MSSFKLYNILYEDSDLVDEMAIQQFKTVGDWSKRSSFSHPVDRALLTSPKSVDKIKRQWENTPYDFDLYFVNDKRVNKSEFREIGEKSLEFVRDKLKITPEEIPDPSEDRITVIYTGNFGDARYMASGWILAHRFGHALNRSRDSSGGAWKDFTDNLLKKFTYLLKEVYGIGIVSGFPYRESRIREKILKFAAQQIGTMKSARDNKLNNWYEFAYELLAQYMLTGKIQFNPLPQSIIKGYAAYGRKEYLNSKNEEAREDYNTYQLESIAETLQYELESILGSCVNRIYVM